MPADLADALVEDDTPLIRQQLLDFMPAACPHTAPSAQPAHLQRLLAMDSTAQADAASARQLFQSGARP
jgi:malonate decarboxylase beta subunit